MIINGDKFSKNPLPALKNLEKFLNVKPFFNESMFIYDKKKKFYCYTRNLKKLCMDETKVTYRIEYFDGHWLLKINKR